MNSWYKCMHKNLINMLIAVHGYKYNLRSILLLDGPELQSTKIMKIQFNKIYYAQYNKKHYDQMIKNGAKNVYYGNVDNIVHKKYDIIYLDLTCTPCGNANFNPIDMLFKIRKQTHIFVTFSLRGNPRVSRQDNINEIFKLKKHFNINYYHNEKLFSLDTEIKTYKRNMVLLFMKKK